MEALSPDEVAVLCCMSFKRLHYGIDHALVRLNAEYGVSSEKRLAINALYMCMEYSVLVFVYVGVCGLRHCFILKCLFGHRMLSAYQDCTLPLWGYRIIPLSALIRVLVI